MNGCRCGLVIDIDIVEENLELDVTEGGGSGGSLPFYKGPYTVTPKVDEQTLATAQKSMSKDVTVEKIPYSEVTNPSGGTTVNIAFIR